MSNSMSAPGARGAGGKRGQEATGAAWPCWHGSGEAAGGGRDGAAGVTSVEALRGEACVQPASAGQQNQELPAALPAGKLSNAKKKCSGLRGGGCSLQPAEVCRWQSMVVPWPVLALLALDRKSVV